MQIVGTGFGASARPVMEVDFTRPTAVVLDNEHQGMDPDVRRHVPLSIGPPLTITVGIFSFAAAIKAPGTDLSQFGIITSPSNP